MEIFQSGVFWAVFLTASFVAYAMYLVAFLFESRVPFRDIPVWKDQSRAFLPGDFCLAFTMAVGAYSYPADITSWAMLAFFAVGLIVGIVVYIVARRYVSTDNDYSKEAWNSPSKKYHDRVMYFFFAGILIAIGIPGYFVSPYAPEKWLGLVGLTIWASLNLWDYTHKIDPRKQRQHPNVYWPIWEKD